MVLEAHVEAVLNVQPRDLIGIIHDDDGDFFKRYVMKLLSMVMITQRKDSTI